MNLPEVAACWACPSVPFLRVFSTAWPSPEAPGADLVVLPHGKIYGKSWKLMKHALKYWEIYSNVIVLVDFPPYSDFPICNDVIFSEGGSTKQIQVCCFFSKTGGFKKHIWICPVMVFSPARKKTTTATVPVFQHTHRFKRAETGSDTRNV